MKNFQSQDFQSESERRRYEAFCNPPGSPDGGDDTNAEMPHGNPRKPDICQVRLVQICIFVEAILSVLNPKPCCVEALSAKLTQGHNWRFLDTLPIYTHRLQVKITFEEFRVQPPVLGDCKFDKMFVVAGGNQLPVFCGANDGQV